jgi:hypothetical protein
MKNNYPKCDLIGVGQDLEPIWLEKVHQACYLVHCLGNTMSPFEFSSWRDCQQFLELITPNN